MATSDAPLTVAAAATLTKVLQPPTAPAFTTSVTSSSITATITDAGGASSFQCSVDGTNWTAGLTRAGLTSNTPYTFRVRGINSDGTGPATSAAVTTDALSGVFFSDDFASGDLSKTSTSDGSSWLWTPTGVNVNANRAFTGSQSVELSYGPDAPGEDTWKQLTFKFGKELTEVWLEYQWYVPSNYAHRDDSPSNNKLLQLSYDSSAFQALTVEALRQSATTSSLKRTMSASEFPGGGNNWPSEPADDSLPDFIGPSFAVKPGQWNQMRVHFRLSPDGTTNGVYELWANGVLFKQFFWPFWSNTYQNRINGGYLMGHANSGYADITEFRIDAFQCFDTDPGWT